MGKEAIEAKEMEKRFDRGLLNGGADSFPQIYYYTEEELKRAEAENRRPRISSLKPEALNYLRQPDFLQELEFLESEIAEKLRVNCKISKIPGTQSLTSAIAEEAKSLGVLLKILGELRRIYNANVE